MVKQRKHTRMKGHCSCCGVYKNDCPQARIPFSELRRIGRKRRLLTKRQRALADE